MVAEKQLDQCDKADGEFLTNVGVRVVLVVPEMVVKELTVDRQRDRDYGHGLAGAAVAVVVAVLGCGPADGAYARLDRRYWHQAWEERLEVLLSSSSRHGQMRTSARGATSASTAATMSWAFDATVT